MNCWLFRFGFVVCLGMPAQPSHSAELAQSLPPHPRLLFTQAELPDIKFRAAGVCKGYYDSLKSRADECLTWEVKLPDRGGQWFHWYSCPKHGARLRTEGPTRHVCPVDQEVFTGYPYDDVVISSEHNRLATSIRTLGIVYQISGDSRYAAKAKEILLAYAAKYQGYPFHDTRGQAKVGGGKVGPQTLDESTWLITVVEGADCFWDTIKSEEQQKIKDGLLLPATQLIRQHKLGIHNIQCWKNSAVGLTGLLLGDMDLIEEALHGPAGYEAQMAKGVTADGPWFEGAWGYHFYTLSAVLHLTEGAYHSGINLYGPELKRMFDAPLTMAMPDLSLPAFNDSQQVDLAGNAGMYQTAFARYKDAQYLILAARGQRGTEAALLHGPTEPRLAPRFEPVSQNFAVSGNAILAAGAGTNATWLCMKYGPHGGGHGHPDKLNFVLYGGGHVIAPDPGTANYGVPIQGGWFRTTLAHNTLTVDEKPQQPAQGRCEAFIATNGFSAVMAEAGKIYDGVEFHRTIAIIGTNLILVVDQIQSDGTHVYDLAYHNFGRFAASEGARFELPDKPGYSFLRDTRATTTSSLSHLAFKTTEGGLTQWALAGGESSTIITGTGVGRHTEDRVPLVIVRRERKSTAYVWSVTLGPDSGRADLEAEPVKFADGSPVEQTRVAAVRVNAGLVKRVLVANPSGKPVLIDGRQVEARIVMLEQGDYHRLRVMCAAR
jgi:oligo-alginate lyase